MANSQIQPVQRDALVILVGITASSAKKKQLRAAFEKRGTFDVYLPRLPFRLGIRACSRFLVRYLRARVMAKAHPRIHVLAYIGGGYAFRLASPSLKSMPIGRIVLVRSPLQELVPRRSVERWSAPLVWLAKGKSVVDMAGDDIMTLPLPDVGTERGLIVETLPSALARTLGLHHGSVPPSGWEHSSLLPGAKAAISLPISHDEAYTDPILHDQVHAFMTDGDFGRMGDSDAGQS